MTIVAENKILICGGGTPETMDPGRLRKTMKRMEHPMA